MLKKTVQKPLPTLLENHFEISSKVVIFRAAENSLLKFKHLVYSRKRGFKMNLLPVSDPLQNLCFIVSLDKK